MDMTTEIGILLAYAFGILILYVVGYIFLMPVKMLLKFVGNSVMGGVAVLLVNWLGGYIGLHIPLNLFSAVAVGFLGVPGVALLLILNHLIL